MRRKFIELDKLDIFDEMHYQTKEGWEVDEAKDGQSTEKHKEGIAYIMGVLEEGRKIMPILALDNEDGTYTRLDGFKRCMAHRELGRGIIEAFVCSQEEYRRQELIPFGNSYMRCFKGGQPKEEYSLFEGNAEKEDDILYWNNDVEGLRIEVAENVQIHWSKFGRYRLSLGRRDFVRLAQAIQKI